jgi:trehalose/maltose transport system substrate-binding protein
MSLRRWAIFGFVIFTGCDGAQTPARAVKVTILGLTLEAGDQLKRDVLNEYAKKTGIETELVPTMGNSAEQLGLILSLFGRRAPAPDVYVIDLVWPATLTEHLEDLTPHVRAESRTHLAPLLKSGTIDGHVVALPFYMSAGTLYYRADLLRKYGYAQPPQTWTELARAARRIQQGERSRGRKDFWGYVWQGAPYEGLTCNALEWQASYGGGHVIEDSGAVSVNNPRAIRAMKTAASWVGTISPPGVIAYMETDSQNAFRKGNAAFLRYWSSGYRNIAVAMAPHTVGIAPLPAGPAGRSQTIGGFHLAVSRYSKHPREAIALVQHLTSAEVQARRAISRGFLPTYAHVYERPDFARAFPESSAVLHAIPQSVVLRPALAAGSKYGAVTKGYYQTVHGILTGRLRAEEALASLESTLQGVMGGASPKGPD